MIKKLSNEKVKKILEFVLLPIILCLVVVSGIFFSDTKTSSSRQNNNADISQNSPANATVHADLGSNEAVLLKNWQSKLVSLISEAFRSDSPSFSSLNTYYFNEIIVTRNASYLQSETDLNVTSNPENLTNLKYAKGFSICATDETGSTYSDSGDITAYITGVMPYIKYNSNGYVSSSASRTVSTRLVIYSEKNILAPIDSSSLFISESDGYYSSTRRKTSIVLENFSTRNVTNMSSMFRYYGNTSNTSVLDLSNCDFTTSNVTNMSYMFANTRLKTAGVGDDFALNFGSNFSTLKVENMSYMFAGYGLHSSSSYYTNSIFTTIDLSFNKFTTTSVTNMQNIFFACTALTTVRFATTFNTSNVTNMSSMFKDCSALTTLDLSQATFNTSKVTTMANMFEYSGFRTAGVGSQYGLNFGNFWNISSVTNFTYMFSGDTYYSTSSTDGIGSGINYLQQIDLSGWTTPREEVEGLSVNCSYMFFRCGNVTKINFSSNDGNNNNDNFFADNITNMSYMFWGCTKLTDLYFGVNFQPKKVTSFSYMCYHCTSLVGVDFTYFYTQKATNMSFMFYNCYNLTSLDLRAFNTAKVTTFQSMFAIESSKTSRLASLTLNFNTTSASSMRNMFAYCSGLTSLELSSFNTSTVTDMYRMFYNCRGFSSVGSNNLNQSFALNLGNNFYTNNVTN
ncbi:MAG: BspA family leucine-rich repeat surface protein, partial [Clostridia bacterium]|nr:BspA family leucine-rich repeat surface protein [Clostridia bacterium]